MKITRYSPLLLAITILLTACQNKRPALATLTPAPTPNLTIQAEEEQVYGYTAYYGGVAIWGDQVYFGYGKNLYWLDISDPEHPKLSGHEPLPNQLSHISLQNGTAHLILNTPSGMGADILANGWQQMDISDPAQPYLTTFYDAPFNLQRLLLYRDRAFLAAWTPELYQLDVSDAAAPRTYPSLPGFKGSVLALAQYEHYLLVAAASCLRTCDSTLTILDAQNPNQLQVVSEFSHYGQFRNLWVHDHWVTIAGTEIITLDISHPAQPRQISSYSPPTFLAETILNGNYLYATSSGLSIYDLSQPDQPRYVEQYLPNIYTGQIALDGNLLALAAPQDGIFLFSLANPAAPRELVQFQLRHQDTP